uniref:site-specific DNA-methyltransferase (adenine-specific) n=1 Tax=Candidatus Methanophagaceae archaeon ANME-1 ERB6 TaxID=2759912 RepID=A0A7G9YZ79_9EURY|nr:hypothetical protein AFNPGKIM_00009 [Methanosarcinales archaeon ANME-1 ERB6]
MRIILRYLFEVKEDIFTPKLRQLFFGVLNTPKDERFDVNERFREIPYLNGSLFVHTEVEKRNVDYKIKAEILKTVIEFLDSFKFVHKEQLGNEDSIDPEILGYIFERTMTATDRKGTGAYYTLEEIWKGIVQEIKVLDNACGSGAFLLTAANILFELNRRIDDKLGLGNSDIALKKWILVHNLYGVDINPSGIEIAKLRLWLWLVDSYEPERIEPLPNIDYNLRVGNSLIGYVDINDFRQTKLNFLNHFMEEEKPTLDEFLNERNPLLQKYKRAEREEARGLKDKINELDAKIQKLLNGNLYLNYRARGIKISKEDFLHLKPFHWGFEFYDVFDSGKPEEERGFNIIIGNPPYVELSKVGYGYLLPESRNLYDAFMRISIKKKRFTLRACLDPFTRTPPIASRNIKR